MTKRCLKTSQPRNQLTVQLNLTLTRQQSPPSSLQRHLPRQELLLRPQRQQVPQLTPKSLQSSRKRHPKLPRLAISQSGSSRQAHLSKTWQIQSCPSCTPPTQSTRPPSETSSTTKAPAKRPKSSKTRPPSKRRNTRPRSWKRRSERARPPSKSARSRRKRPSRSSLRRSDRPMPPRRRRRRSARLRSRRERPRKRRKRRGRRKPRLI